jgi:hypothetical protein
MRWQQECNQLLEGLELITPLLPHGFQISSRAAILLTRLYVYGLPTPENKC